MTISTEFKSCGLTRTGRPQVPHLSLEINVWFDGTLENIIIYRVSNIPSV